ncbi:hypothetical protein KBD18_00750 [Patescibacteria group bacterium]|nr:hypothetical protein [Patescibacteria group bacterium]
MTTPEVSISAATEQKMSRNKKIGLFFLIAPFVSMVTTLVLFAVISVASRNALGGQTASVVLSVTNVLLGFIGIVSLVALVVGIPLGIIFLRKKEWVEGTVYDTRSGKGKDSIIPPEIKAWNWGAFGIPFIWSAWHGVWLGLLAVLPFVGFILSIILGILGNEWAWRKNRWVSVEAFQQSQKKWVPWGIGIFVLNAIITLARFVPQQ